MAKNKVKIDVSVDDKGSTKKVGVGARKAADGLDKAGTSAHSTDRRLKGASQQSSNTTKNFSKMAQGITGGLVPAYATLASTLFAVSAAFNFLKKAGDLAVLREGQVAYASSTGIALRTLTKDIQAAAGNMLTFADASQAAAIGISSGLSQDQLIRLGKVAKDTSIILGRDVTDSFNRLIRGATKAEPELLDELGIILRLDDAFEKYKNSMGLIGQELTTFERQQAVTNFVLEEGERKYSAILKILEVQPNVYAQLGKAFDDITNKIRLFVEKGLKPLARVLTDTPELAIAAFGLFGASIMKSIIPGLANLGTASKAAFEESAASTARATAKLMAYNNALSAGRGDKAAGAALQASARAGIAGTLKASGAGAEFTRTYKTALNPDANLTKKQIQQMINDYKRGSGQIMLLSKKQRTALLRDLNDYQLGNKLTQNVVVADTQRAHNRLRIIYMETKLVSQTLFNGIKTGAAVAGRALGFLMGAFGWISLIVTAIALFKDFIKQNEKLTPAQEAAAKAAKEHADNIQRLGERFKSLNEELRKMPEILAELNSDRTGLGGALNFAGTIGNAIGNLNVDDFVLSLDMAKRSAIEFGKIKIRNKDLVELGQFAATGEVPKGEDPLDMGDRLLRAIKIRKKSDPTGRLTDKQAVQQIIEQGKESDAIMGNFLGNRTEVVKEVENFVNLIRDSIDTGFNQNPIFAELDIFQQLQTAISKPMDQINADTIAGLTDKALKFTKNKIQPLIRLQKDNASATRELLAEFMPESKHDLVAQSLKTQLDITRDIQDNMKENKDLLNDQITSLEKQVKLFIELANIGRKQKLESAELQLQINKAVMGGTPLQIKHFLERAKVRQLEQKILHLRQRQLTVFADQNNKEAINKQIVEDKKTLEVDLTNQKKHNLAMMQIETEQLKAQLQLERDRLSFRTQNRQAFEAGFEGATTAGINDLLTGRQSSFGDAALGSVKGGLESVAGQVSERFSRGISDFMFGGLGMERERSESEILNEVFDPNNGALRVILAEDKKTTDLVGDPKEGFVDKMKKGTKEFATEFKDIWTDGNNSFKDKISKTFKLGGDTLGDVFNSFKDGFKDVLSGVGDFFGSLFGGGGARYGGIMQARNGGIMKGYATGGIARGRDAGYPAILHGTEAVVPLPSGKEIPVEMKGNTGNNISTSITVNIDGKGNSTSSVTSEMTDDTSEQGRHIGKLISKAVQEELVKQQRAGGILSPIGA